jgi:hypothetical protein
MSDRPTPLPKVSKPTEFAKIIKSLRATNLFDCILVTVIVAILYSAAFILEPALPVEFAVFIWVFLFLVLSACRLFFLVQDITLRNLEKYGGGRKW